MPNNYITTQFTTSEPILKKGTEIYQVDLSGLIVGSLFKEMAVSYIRNREVLSIAEACENHIKEQQEAGVPLVVDSEPVLVPENRWFTGEYYIRVYLNNEPRLHYYIMNPIPVWMDKWTVEGGKRVKKRVRRLLHTFLNASNYLEYIYDAEGCASCGY